MNSKCEKPEKKNFSSPHNFSFKKSSLIYIGTYNYEYIVAKYYQDK